MNEDKQQEVDQSQSLYAANGRRDTNCLSCSCSGHLLIYFRSTLLVYASGLNLDADLEPVLASLN